MISPDFPAGGQPIVLTTDFGLSDNYVGVMKGVILGINPRALLLDLTHQIQPQNILQASLLLSTAYRYFPAGSIHVVVVDPGVGTSRQALLLLTPHGRFLAPDNGILSQVIAEYAPNPEAAGLKIAVPGGLEAYSLTNSRYWLERVSHTFHGRDVFAPVAAHLSLGVPPGLLGERVENITWLPVPKPLRQERVISGEVIVVDHFGNLSTNITADALPALDVAQVEIKGRSIPGLSQTFHDRGNVSDQGLVALLGSNGYLEVAYPDGSAAAFLGVGVGEPVRVLTKGDAISPP